MVQEQTSCWGWGVGVGSKVNKITKRRRESTLLVLLPLYSASDLLHAISLNP